MISVVLRFKSGAQQEVVLADVPRKDDRILLRDPREPSLVVEHVLWLEGGNGRPETPSVVISVRNADE
jgi:hypothetical protein